MHRPQAWLRCRLNWMKRPFVTNITKFSNNIMIMTFKLPFWVVISLRRHYLASDRCDTSCLCSELDVTPFGTQITSAFAPS